MKSSLQCIINPSYQATYLFFTRNPMSIAVVCLAYLIMSMIPQLSFGQAGSLDPTFVPAAALEGTQAIAVQSDGKIVSGGGFTDQPNNSRLNADGSRDLTFSNTGINNQVRSIGIQPDGKIVLGGDFVGVNGTSQNRIARINSNGSLDASFNTGTGASGPIFNLQLQIDGKIMIVGQFTSFNGISRNRVARLNQDGSLDSTFDPGSGPDGFTTFAVAIQSDGKVLIGGNFTSFNGTSRNRIARINSDGSLDASFNPGSGANGNVQRILVQNDGKIIIVGNFTSYNGVSRNRIARLNSNGTLDTSFNPGSSANNFISKVALQPDQKTIIVGDFTTYNGVSQNRIARLNADGTLDTTFNPGSGANASVSEIVVTDDKVVISGSFTQYNGTTLSKWARVHTLTDVDGDNVDDAIDNCSGLSNPNQANADGDSHGDDCDDCPTDPNKIAEGLCGCGTADTDTDDDGVPDCNDGCPDDPDKVYPGECGCGLADVDSDEDGTLDCIDGCPSDPNKVAPGQCGCGAPDVDDDCDGVANCHDVCPNGDDSVDTDADGNHDCQDYPGFSFLPASWTCNNNNNAEKVLICHDGVTLCVSENSLAQHLAHGDNIGPCQSCAQEMIQMPDYPVSQTEEQFELFPNPVTNLLNIKLKGFIGAMELTVTDQLGRIIRRLELEEGMMMTGIEVSGDLFRNGIYYVNVKSQNQQITRRIIVAK